MTSKELNIGDWIRILWIPYNLYIVNNNDNHITVSSPSWGENDTMIFQHHRLDYNKNFRIIGKSKLNPFYNTLTKLTGFIHPVVLIKH